MSQPSLSVVIATRNRKETLLATLDHLHHWARDGGAAPPIFVVDNASDDGTAAALAARRDVIAIPLSENRGACAKALALPRVATPLTLFLDDDARPRPGTYVPLLELFRHDARLGAAGFRAILPNGFEECSALPHVFVGCGVALRTQALRDVGGLDLSLFMAAEEYDLSFRLIQAGWRVDLRTDLIVDHLKTADGRAPATLAYYDVRNNLRLLARYLPPEPARVYHEDWQERYRLLAEEQGAGADFARGVADAQSEEWTQRGKYQEWRLSPDTFERLFAWEYLTQRFRELRAAGVRRVALLDLGKNVYAFHQAAERAGVALDGIGDDRFARLAHEHQGHNPTYRGKPLRTVDETLRRPVDAFVVSNCAHAHAQRRFDALRGRTSQPVFHWFALRPAGRQDSSMLDSPIDALIHAESAAC